MGDRADESVWPQRLTPRPSADRGRRESKFSHSVPCRCASEREERAPPLDRARPECFLFNWLEWWQPVHEVGDAPHAEPNGALEELSDQLPRET